MYYLLPPNEELPRFAPLLPPLLPLGFTSLELELPFPGLGVTSLEPKLPFPGLGVTSLEPKLLFLMPSLMPKCEEVWCLGNLFL